MVGDHVLIRMRSGLSRASLEGALSELPAGLQAAVRSNVSRAIFLVRFDGEQPGAMEEILRRLLQSGVIEVSEPDFLVRAS